MRFSPVPLMITVGTFSCLVAAKGAVILTEPFNYNPVGDSLPAPYVESGSTGVGEIAADLSFPGLVTSGNAATSSDRFTTSERPLGQSFNTAGTNTTETFYMSYLVNVANVASWGGNAMIGISLGGAGSDEGFYTGVVGNTADGQNNKDWGVIAGRPNTSSGSANRADIPANITAGTEVYFVLAKFEIDTSGNYDTVPGGLRAWMSVYSTSDGLPTSEPLTWDAHATADRGFPWTGPTTVLDTLTLDRGNSPVQAVWDEVKLGTTFADVTVIPEPASGVLALTACLLFLSRRSRRS